MNSVYPYRNFSSKTILKLFAGTYFYYLCKAGFSTIVYIRKVNEGVLKSFVTVLVTEAITIK